MRPFDLSLRRLAASALALCLAASAASADSVAVEALRDAAAQGARGDWPGAEAAAEDGGPLVATIAEWMRLRDSEASFAEVAGFVAAHPDWPDLDDLRANGETSIPPDADPAGVIAFFRRGDAPDRRGRPRARPRAHRDGPRGRGARDARGGVAQAALERRRACRRSPRPFPNGWGRCTGTVPTRCFGAGAPRTRSGCCRSWTTGTGRWCARASR
jgi:hypothetical protein